MMEEIENIEEELKFSYNKRRYEYERKAIDKISINPSEFYKYADKLKINRMALVFFTMAKNT